MTGREAVRLVARREIVERMRERSLWISTIVTLVILAAIVLVPAALDLGGDDEYTVAVAGGKAEEVARIAERLAPDAGATVTVERVRDDAAVRRAVRDDEADAGLASDGREIVVLEELPDKLGSVLQQGARIQRTEQAPPPGLPVRELDPPEKGAEQSEGIAFVAVLLLYFQLIGYGFWLASGVVEEKTSRVVELLLSTIRPTQLLAGKIIGIGIVGLGQLLIIAGVGVGVALAAGSLDVPSSAIGALGIVLAWFMVGYAFYACLFAVAGAIVPRQEELQNSISPLTIMLLGSFMFSFAALNDPDGTLSTALSFVPPSAPLVMPIRIIASDVPAWQVVLSVAIVLVAVAALVAFAARIYSNAILRTGARVKLAEAWRAARA